MSIQLTPGGHVATIKPDERLRFALKAFATREPTEGWRVHIADDGRTIALEAIVKEEAP